MRADFADRCTDTYMIVDARSRPLAAAADQRPGPRAVCTDSALSTLTLVAELLGLDAETRCLAYLRRNHLALFLRLPERSRYNRRRRRLIEGTNRLRGGIMARLWRVLAAAGRDRCGSDSLPVPVVGDHHAAGEQRWWGAAACGRGPAKQQRVYGCKLHLLLSHSGRILDVALAPANHRDGKLAAQLLEDQAGPGHPPGWVVIGDQGASNGPLQAQLAARQDLPLLTPQRKNQRAPLPAALPQAINHFRQRSETVKSQLVGPFRLHQHRAKSLFGLAARVQAKLAAHTLGLYLNHLLGRPLRALADLAVI